MRVLLGLVSVLLALAGCGQKVPVDKRLDPEVAGLIHDLVDGSDYDRRMAAHDRLQTYGDVVVMPLADALDREDVDAGVGAWIAEVLGSLGPVAEPAAAALSRRLMQGGDCSATTSWALGQIGVPAVPYLVHAMASPHVKTRVWASHALLALEERAAPAADAFLKALEDEDEEVRGNAASAIAHLPAVQARALPKLLQMTRDLADPVRQAAAQTLASVYGGDDAVQNRLREVVLGDPEPYVQDMTLDALDAHLGRDADDIAFLRRVVDLPREEGAPRAAARTMLLERGVDEAGLVAAVAKFDKGASFASLLKRSAVLAASGPNGREAALPLLVRVLEWAPEEDERVSAAEALGRLAGTIDNDGPAMQALRAGTQENSEEPAVSAACAEAVRIVLSLK